MGASLSRVFRCNRHFSVLWRRHEAPSWHCRGSASIAGIREHLRGAHNTRLTPGKDYCSVPLSLCCRAVFKSQGGFGCLCQECFPFYWGGTRLKHPHHLFFHQPRVPLFGNSMFSVTEVWAHVISGNAPLYGGIFFWYLGGHLELTHYRSELTMLT